MEKNSIEFLKSKKKCPSGYWIGNVILSDNTFKIVLISLIDEENEIFSIKTNGKKMANEKKWTPIENGFYIKEVLIDEINAIWSWAPHSAN